MRKKLEERTAPRVRHGALFWSWQCDSNTRPADYESAALPTELCQHAAVHPDRKRYCSIKENASQQIFSREKRDKAGLTAQNNYGLYKGVTDTITPVKSQSGLVVFLRKKLQKEGAFRAKKTSRDAEKTLHNQKQ